MLQVQTDEGQTWNEKSPAVEVDAFHQRGSQRRAGLAPLAPGCRRGQGLPVRQVQQEAGDTNIQWGRVPEPLGGRRMVQGGDRSSLGPLLKTRSQVECSTPIKQGLFLARMEKEIPTTNYVLVAKQSDKRVFALWVQMHEKLKIRA